MSSRGPPKGVCQSLSSYVQQCVGEGVGQYTRHNPYEILPTNIADSLCPKGSRLAHLYGLPKTHKANLCMRPILSATGTYNYNLAKWLEEKLKPLSVNEYTITDAFRFSEEIRAMSIQEDNVLVSYDVTALFTNVPLNETINILVDKAFANDWFNQTYKLSLQKEQLARLLEIATTNQLFQFNGQLYEQVDGVAMIPWPKCLALKLRRISLLLLTVSTPISLLRWRFPLTTRSRLLVWK